jgi:hypothetical protein
MGLVAGAAAVGEFEAPMPAAPHNLGAGMGVGAAANPNETDMGEADVNAGAQAAHEVYAEMMAEVGLTPKPMDVDKGEGSDVDSEL